MTKTTSAIKKAAWLLLLTVQFSWAGGEAAYGRCAACHLGGGEGIAGAFPPLKNRIGKFAASEAGRAYLISVIQHGLQGPVAVAGVNYMGVMPAQGAAYSPEQIVALLNYMLANFGPEQHRAKAFSLAEVKAALARPGSAPGNAELRRTLLAAQPELGQ